MSTPTPPTPDYGEPWKIVTAGPNGAHDVTEGVLTIQAMRDALKETSAALDTLKPFLP